MKAELYFERALINVAAWGMCVYSRETKVFDVSIRMKTTGTRSGRKLGRPSHLGISQTLTIAVKSLNTLIWINDPCRVSETLSMVGERKVAKAGRPLSC